MEGRGPTGKGALKEHGEGEGNLYSQEICLSVVFGLEMMCTLIIYYYTFNIMYSSALFSYNYFIKYLSSCIRIHLNRTTQC
jgi:hypothetical protein